jgi:hypothetical protein
VALNVTHTTQSAVPDEHQPGIIGPDAWNANHTITGSVTASEVTGGAALTTANDTNVTLSAGGSSASALLAASSITAGWTGTLAASRGGTGIASLGTGIATFLGTPSSANLAAAVTDETGSGALVFATSPSLVTPTLGVATATSINKVAITAPATGATLTIGDGLTLTYDEGSWTPVLVGGTTPGSQTYTAQVGRYIRIGNSVSVWCRIALSALDGTSAGAATITGLPFTSTNVVGLNFPGFVGPAALITHQAGYNQFVAQVGGGATSIVLQEIGDNIVNSSVPITNFHSTSTLQVMIQYRTG